MTEEEHHHHDQESHRKEALEIFRIYLKKNGLSVTKPREKVLNAIYGLEGHFTVDELESILEDFTGSRRATIYRTIKHMLEAGLLAKVQTNTHAKVAYEHTIGHPHHDHLVCDRCGSIVEFNDEQIEALQEKVAEKFGFKLLYHSTVMTGVCPTCQNKMEKRSPSNVIVTV
jgi:Fur family ferric uptake transcriptional regulator